MIAKIKLIIAAIASLGAAVLYALLQTEKTKRAKQIADAEKEARKAEKRASEALYVGLKKENEVRNAKPKADIVSHFNK